MHSCSCGTNPCHNVGVHGIDDMLQFETQQEGQPVHAAATAATAERRVC